MVKIKPKEYVRIGSFDYHTAMWVTNKPFNWSKGTIGKKVRRADGALHKEIKNSGIYNSTKRRNKFIKSYRNQKNTWIRWDKFPRYAKA